MERCADSGGSQKHFIRNSINIKIMETRLIGSLTEIYITGGGNFVTQAYPTNFHTFHTRKILVGSEKPSDFKEVTAAEKSALEAQNAKWLEPSEEFVTQCKSLGIEYFPSTGFFGLNGLTDLTEDDARKIINATYPGRQINDLSAAFSGMSFRTNLPVATFQKSEHGLRMRSAFRSASGVEVINLDFQHGGSQPALRIVGTPLWIFPHIQSLKKILGPITFVERAPAYNGWPIGLEDVQIHALSVDLDMRVCSKLTLASVKYIIDNAENSKPISITVHADVFAKLTDETDTEWHQVLLDAAEKQITFATPS